MNMYLLIAILGGLFGGVVYGWAKGLHFNPTLYRDIHATEGDKKHTVYYIRSDFRNFSGPRQYLWRGVRHWFGPFYCDHLNPNGKVREFADWPNNFEELSRHDGTAKYLP